MPLLLSQLCCLFFTIWSCSSQGRTWGSSCLEPVHRAACLGLQDPAAGIAVWPTISTSRPFHHQLCWTCEYKCLQPLLFPIFYIIKKNSVGTTLPVGKQYHEISRLILNFFPHCDSFLGNGSDFPAKFPCCGFPVGPGHSGGVRGADSAEPRATGHKRGLPCGLQPP